MNGLDLPLNKMRKGSIHAVREPQLASNEQQQELLPSLQTCLPAVRLLDAEGLKD